MLFYTTTEVAKKIGVSRETISYYIRKKELRAIKLGRGYKITEEDLKNFITSRQTK